MTFWKYLCVGGDVSGKENLETSDRTDKDKDEEEDEEECVQANLGQTKLAIEKERENTQDDNEPYNIQSHETESSSAVPLVEELVTEATHETNLGSSSRETEVSSADSKNGPGSDSASSVSLLEVSKGNDFQHSSTDDSEEVKFKQFENMCLVKK